MFEKLVFDYDKLGLKVVPIVNGQKACRVSAWSEVDFTLCADKYTGFGVGLSLGDSDLVMLDLDFEDEKLKIKVNEFLKDYPTPVLRQGNPKRPPARFYNKTWQTGKVSHSNKDNKAGVELMCANKGQMIQVVIPPTLHPSGTPYKWVGTHGLSNFPLDNLPDFPETAWEKLKEIIGNDENATGENKTEIYQGETGRCANGSNIKYSEMVRAAVLAQEPIDSIIQSLISYDEKNQEVLSFFLCKNGKNWKTNDIKANAYDFVHDAYMRAIKQGDISSIGGDDFKISIKTVKAKNIDREKYPKFRGIAQEMFKYIYQNSPVPRSRLACASVISTMSITLANKITIDGIYPNFYNLMVAPSGFGKDFPLKFVKRALMETGNRELIGQSMPASDTGIIKTLDSQRERIDIIDEASILFGSITNGKNDYASKMADVYASLFTSTGDFYEGKTLASSNKIIGACHSPYITMLGAMTPDAAAETITHQLIQTGLGARFLYFIDDEKKRGRRVGERPDMPTNIKRFIKMWRSDNDSQRISIVSGLNRATPRRAVIDNNSFLDKIYDEVEKIKEKSDKRVTPLLNRAYTTICKLALIDACSTQQHTTEISVREDNFDWAVHFFRVNFSETKEFIFDQISGSKREKDLNKVHEFIKSKKESGATMSDLARSMRAFDAKYRKALLEDLVDGGNLVVSKEETVGRPIIRFFSHKYVK